MPEEPEVLHFGGRGMAGGEHEAMFGDEVENFEHLRQQLSIL